MAQDPNKLINRFFPYFIYKCCDVSVLGLYEIIAAYKALSVKNINNSPCVKSQPC